VSNMNSVPLIRRALCAAAPAKMQVPAKRKLCLRQLRRGGAAALSFGYDFPPVALPAEGRSVIERCIIRGPVATTPAPLRPRGGVVTQRSANQPVSLDLSIDILKYSRNAAPLWSMGYPTIQNAPEVEAANSSQKKKAPGAHCATHASFAASPAAAGPRVCGFPPSPQLPRRGSLRLRCGRWAPPSARRPFLCLEDSDSLFGSVGRPRLLGDVRHRRHLR
jgi:hypothetical protein